VLADQNSQRNVKKTLRLQRDAPESTTDVQEDVWEKHVELVQELHVQQKMKKLNWKNAEEPTEEVAEDFTAEELSEDTEKFTTKENTRKFTKEKRKLLCSKKNSLKRDWKLIAEELQSENVEKKTKNA